MPEGGVTITIQAVDEASGTIKNIAGSLGKLRDSASEATRKNAVLSDSLKDVGKSTMALATSAFSLYMAYDRVEERTVSYQRSLLMLHNAQIQLARAQEAYSNAVARYGPDSTQAAIAAEQLAKAQEALSVAQERARVMQQNVNEEMMRAALVAIPSVITAINSFRELASAASAVSLTAGVSLATLGKWAAIVGSAFIFGYKAAEWWDKGGKRIIESSGTLSDAFHNITYASMGMIGATEEGADSMRAFREEGENAAEAIIRNYQAWKTQEEALKSLSQRYKEGAIGLREFVEAALAANIPADAIEKKLMEIGDVVPQTIAQQLVGKAQNLVKQFQECSSGKFADINEAGTENFEELVENTNDLIRHGLVGQAQENIKAFANCSTGKQYAMAYNIGKIVDGMVKKTEDQYRDMVNSAKKLSGEQKDAALRNAEEWKKEQYKKIDALRQLQNTALTQMGVDAKENAKRIGKEMKESWDEALKGMYFALPEDIPSQKNIQVNITTTGAEEAAQAVQALPDAKEIVAEITQTGYEAVSALINSIPTAVQTVVSVIQQGAEGVLSAINSIPKSIEVFVNFVASGLSGLGGFGGIGNYPAVYMQTGGLVTRPTLAVLGEAGPELVLPAPLTRRLMEGAGIGGPSRVNVNITMFNTVSREADERRLAKTVSRALADALAIRGRW